MGFETLALPALGEHLRSVGACQEDVAACSSARGLTFELAPARRRGLGFASISAAASGDAGLNPLFTIAKAAKVAQKKFKVVKVTGDGRCMFRAMAKGLAYNQGVYLSGEAETKDADELRLAVAETLCGEPKRRAAHKDALLNIKTQYDMDTYCRHIRHEGFWGGEAELLVLSRMLRVPVVIYLSNKEAKRAGAGYTPIAKYGREYVGQRKPVRLLYTGGNHYDLLLA